MLWMSTRRLISIVPAYRERGGGKERKGEKERLKNSFQVSGRKRRHIFRTTICILEKRKKERHEKKEITYNDMSSALKLLNFR